MQLSDPPLIFISPTQTGSLVVIKVDEINKRISVDPTGAEYIVDFNLGAKITPCSLRQSVRNNWINLTPLPYEVILRDNYALGIYLINSGINVKKDVQQFPLQTEKFILFTLPIELQRTLSERAAVRAAATFMNAIQDQPEVDYDQRLIEKYPASDTGGTG